MHRRVRHAHIHICIHTLTHFIADRQTLSKTLYRGRIVEAVLTRLGGGFCSVGADEEAETSKRLVRSPASRLFFLLLKVLAARSTLSGLLPCSFMSRTRSTGSSLAMMCPIVASRSISRL